MSIGRMSKSERASYLIGEAFRKFLVDQSQDSGARKAAWTAYVAVIDACLDPDEHEFVMVETGYVDPSWFGEAGSPVDDGHDREDEDPPF